MSAPAESAPVAAAAAAPALPAVAPKSLETRTIALSGDQLAYLAMMVERYSLGSFDKACRILANYALQDGDQRFIFATFRCRKCGIKFPKKDTPVTLYAHQWAFLDRMREEHKVMDAENNGKVFRVLLDFTQEGRTKRGMTDAQKGDVLEALEKEIFVKVRCNDPVCTHQH